MLVIVICLFAICWAPVQIENVLAAFGVVESLNYNQAIKHMRQAFALMSYANSCVNPIVYAFMSRNFRESFMYALCSCLPSVHPNASWAKRGTNTTHINISFKQPHNNCVSQLQENTKQAVGSQHAANTHYEQDIMSNADYKLFQGSSCNEHIEEPSVITDLLQHNDVSDAETNL